MFPKRPLWSQVEFLPVYTTSDLKTPGNQSREWGNGLGKIGGNLHNRSLQVGCICTTPFPAGLIAVLQSTESCIQRR